MIKRGVFRKAGIILIAVVMIGSTIVITAPNEQIVNLNNEDSQRVIWDNGMEFEGYLAAIWDETINYDTYEADDFQFDTDTIVRYVKWVGGYFDDYYEGGRFDWSIVFYSDRGDGNAPGNIFAGPFEYTHSKCNPILLEDTGENSYIQFMAKLPENIEFKQGVKYWVSIWGIGKWPPQSALTGHFDVILHQGVYKSEYRGYPEWTDVEDVVYVGVPADVCFQLWTYIPPTIPEITGPASGETDVTQNYTFSSTDIDGYNVSYTIEWGDGSDDFIGPFQSGEEVTASHTWSEEGTYVIRAKVHDVYKGESDWGTLEISMPKTKVHSKPSLKFLEKYTRLFRKDPPASWLEGSDQTQTISSEYGFVINPLFSCAQEFKPSQPTLTAVALPIFRFGSPPSGTMITVVIRDELDGNDLTLSSINANDWRIRKSTWVLFDFEDIDVIPEESYYIVCTADKGTYDENDDNNSNTYCWNFEFDNKYPRGIAYQSNDSGWHDLENYWNDPEYVECDYAFITYYQEPKYKTIFNPFLRFLENHPWLFPILRLLVK